MNPGVSTVLVNCETATVYVGKQIIYIKVKNDVTWLFTWHHFINKLRQNVLFCFVPLDGVVGIQAEKPRGIPHEKYIGVSNGSVIKGLLYGGCDKGHVHVFIPGMQNSVFYSKYILNCFTTCLPSYLVDTTHGINFSCTTAMMSQCILN